MKLSVGLLFERLKEQFEVTASSKQTNAPLLERPLLFQPGVSVVAERLYISQTAAQSLCRPDVCTIYLDGAAPELPGGSSICIKASLGQVLNALQQLWDEFDRWNARMEQLLLVRGDIQELLQASANLLGNPIALVTQNFSIEAHVGMDELPEEQQVYYDEARSQEILNALEQDTLYNQMLESRQPYLYPAHILPFRSWNVNLPVEGDKVLRLMLAEHRKPLRDSDGWLLSCLAPYVIYLLEQEKQSARSNSSLHTLFMRILSDRTADYVEISRQLTRRGWEPEDNNLCMVFQPWMPDTEIASVNRICNYMERQYSYCCAFYYEPDANIVCYFNLTKMKCGADTLESEVKFFIRDNYLKAGNSRPMQGHSTLRRQYIQAYAALDIGGRIHPHLWIHQFNNVALQFMLEQSTRRLPGEMVCHEKLLLLRAHDEAQNTDYCKTLRTFLDSNMNATQTAKALFIHRSTLLYRLERIEELLDSSLEDPEERLYLSLSFRLLENERKTY